MPGIKGLSGWPGISACVALLLTLVSGPAAAEPEIPECAPAIGRVVSRQGAVDIRRAGSGAWHRVQRLDSKVCDGDAVRTGPRSRAALWLKPESLIRLDQNTAVLLFSSQDETRVDFFQAGVGPRPDPDCGTAYFISRFPHRFGVGTPFLSAAIKGTEFLVADQCSATTLAVVEGIVAARELQSGREFRIESLEQISVGMAEPPAIKVLVRPADAVQWAIFYPPLFERRSSTEQDSPLECGAVAREERPACLLARAEDLLHAGQAEQAEVNIRELIELQPGNAEARGLRAIINLAKNEETAALEFAREATNLAPDSYRSWLALSYVEQSQFKLDDALNSARRASRLAPGSAHGKARVSELLLSLGRVQEAESFIRTAVAEHPGESRVLTILGFVHLAQIDIAAARQDFLGAIERDSTDPLPRVGLGLAEIRKGNLVQGREQIEIAVALDPLNSLLRSYLGKAYFEENTQERNELVGIQLGIAKQVDPKDPTPWLYDGILKQAQNRPVEAMESLRESIRRNDNRMINRSRLLIDEDRATRQVSTARTYSDLGFEQRAMSEAAQSLGIDPANASAHRFLSDTYSAVDRHEIGRVSELLQSQLLQPLNSVPLAPSAPFSDLGVTNPARARPSFFSDNSQLFEQEGLRLRATGFAGNLGTRSDEVNVSTLAEKVSVSMGQYFHTSDGYRANNDIKHEIYNAFVQYSPDTRFSLQAEYRKRLTTHGDLTSNFDPASYSSQNRFDLGQEAARLGFRISPSPSVRILGSVINNRRTEFQRLFSAGAPDTRLNGAFEGTASELQIHYIGSSFNVVAGAGHAPVETNVAANFDFTSLIGSPCAPPVLPCGATSQSKIRQQTAYLYSNITLSSDLTLTLGVGHDLYDDGTTELKQWNPKMGIQWAVTRSIRLRAAGFRTIKRSLLTDQTIEPTQLAGFTQFFDDFNGTESKVLAAGMELTFNQSFGASIEALHRDITLAPGLLGPTLAATPPQGQSENGSRVTFHWIARRYLVATAGYVMNDFRWEPTVSPTVFQDQPLFVRTQCLPLSLRLFAGPSWYGQATATHVRQEVARSNGAPPMSGSSDFWTVDVSAGYLLPRRRGAVGVEIRNLLDEKFSFQDDNYRTSEYRSPLYIPARSILFKVWLTF